IAAKHKVELMGFAQEAWDAKLEPLSELFEPPGAAQENAQEGKKPRERASAFTDLSSPLVRALERSGSGADGKVLGIVLLTDGQHNWHKSPVAKAIELGHQELPIYPIAIGARKPPP